MKSLNKYFDHTILKADASETDIKKLCAEAKEFGFHAVCVNGCHVSLAAKELKDSDVKVAAVIGFPLGAMSSEAKIYEAADCCENGASEIDMVLNIGALKEGRFEYVEDEIAAIVAAADEYEAVVKVIIETCFLSDEQIVRACELSLSTGAEFVKTSTGFSTGGATVEDVKLMRDTVGPDIGVKAAGGIRTFEQAKAMIEAGASRIGASAGIAIVSGK